MRNTFMTYSQYADTVYTLPQKKRNFSEVAFLLGGIVVR